MAKRPTQTRGTTVIEAVTEPRLISAYVRLTRIVVMDRQVEVIVHFDDSPDPKFAWPKKFISRDPEVVAFVHRVHAGIARRTESIDNRIAAMEAAGKDAAA